jgi:superfamily II DNA/RNA helicase
LLKIQTGSFMGSDMANAYTEDELQGDRTEELLPNVRLVNGTTKQESRQKIMLTFNTPFYPEVLIASSVMAEGIDLHLNCRYIIHHDLCWNPSTLEQRNGRVDRIGAKVERCSKPISIYYPFISETQDEKMYRVVMDRERWFKVVMGEKYKLDVRTTEKVASRIPFPDIAAEELMFRLEV